MDFRAVLSRVKEDERYKKASSVAVQLPEGMKRRIGEITREFGGKEVIFIGDPFWGACDIPSNGNWDLLIQFGHSPIPNLGSHPNVIFEEIQEDLDFEVDPNSIPFKSLILTSNVTYSNQLPNLKKKLEESGIQASLKKGDSRVFYPGQILGCNISTARGIEENVLFIGEGVFHPLGIALGLPEKRVIAFNPKNGEYRDMEKEKFLAQRYSASISREVEVAGPHR